jgi:hypothetical protein
VIGIGQVISLEEAVLDCCMWGTPRASSIAALIRSLYERFGADFYNRSRVRSTPEENMKRLHAWMKFEDWLTGWDDTLEPGETHKPDRIQIRREVLGCLAPKRNCLIDPIDYLRSVKVCPEFCPLLLWGCADGDLHGRNVLVSEISDEVTLPAVYDYADMGLDNLVGWDFVKLETELKVRAVPRLLSHIDNWPEYLAAVLKFECHLAACTLAMHNEQKIPKADLGSKGMQRLAKILLTIRQQARRHLGIQRLRDRQWLEEYYFLLACYGVYAARFETYNGYPRQIAAAYISAGVGARQLSRPFRRFNEQVQTRLKQAKELFDKSECQPLAYLKDPSGGEPLLAKPKCEMSHHERLAFASAWVRGLNPSDQKRGDFLEAAITILTKLREQYPHALEIDEELALAYLEANRREDFEKLLANVTVRYSQLSEEFLCRIGRYWKDQAKDLSDKKDVEGATRCYKAALDLYNRAFQLRRNYYPGINVAGLQYILGQREEAARTARAVLASLDRPWPHDQQHWICATRGDAYFLAGEDEAAERLYREAVEKADAHAAVSMRRQVEMLHPYAPEAQRAYWPIEKRDDVFSPKKSTPTRPKE